MPNAPTASKTDKSHPGREAGTTPSQRARGGFQPSETTTHAAPAEPAEQQTAFRGQELVNATEEAINTLCALGEARGDLAFCLDRRDDLMSTEQRQRAVADLERIIGELASGLALVRMGGKVDIIVEAAERADDGPVELGLRRPA